MVRDAEQPTGDLAVATSIWCGEPCSLGEGPLSHHGRSSLVWCDILGRAVFERPFDGGEVRRFDLPIMPSACGIIDERSVLIATERDLRRLDLDDASTEELIRLPAHPELRSNDGRTHPSGAFWIGTMAKRGIGPPGAIYRYFEGKLTLLVDNVGTPNSICFTPDGLLAYFADTTKRTIWQVPTDPATGEIVGDKKIFVRLDAATAGVPDGSVLDERGRLWNSRWAGGAVDVYDASGRLVESYPVPARQPTCPAFIGKHLSELVTTSARAGLKEPASEDGAVIRLDVAACGIREAVVKL